MPQDIEIKVNDSEVTIVVKNEGTETQPPAQPPADPGAHPEAGHEIPPVTQH